MAITRRAPGGPVQDDVSDSRIVVSVALIIALAAIIACLMWVKRRIRQNTLAVPLERLPLHEEQRRKGIDSYLLQSIPVITYRASLESTEHGGVSKIGDSTDGGQGDNPLKGAEAREDNGELPLKNLDASVKNINMPLDEDAAQTKQRRGSGQDSKTCSICTEDFVEGRNVRVLPCRHIYHRRCIDPWLLDFAGTCPLWYVACEDFINDRILTHLGISSRIALQDLVPLLTQPPRPPEPVVLPVETAPAPTAATGPAPTTTPLARVTSPRRILGFYGTPPLANRTARDMST
jgi:hypothetical protein